MNKLRSQTSARDTRITYVNIFILGSLAAHVPLVNRTCTQLILHTTLRLHTRIYCSKFLLLNYTTDFCTLLYSLSVQQSMPVLYLYDTYGSIYISMILNTNREEGIALYLQIV